MALDVDDLVFPYHLSYRKNGSTPCLGTYQMFTSRLQGFSREENDNYCLKHPHRYAKLADREWVEW